MSSSWTSRRCPLVSRLGRRVAVAAGATLLAAGETWQITEYHRWQVWLFWLLAVGMLAAAVLNTAVRMISGERTRRSLDTAPEPATEQL